MKCLLIKKTCLIYLERKTSNSKLHRFGKKKLIPQISPNKTFLGFFAGFFITFLPF